MQYTGGTLHPWASLPLSADSHPSALNTSHDVIYKYRDTNRYSIPERVPWRRARNAGRARNLKSTGMTTIWAKSKALIEIFSQTGQPCEFWVGPVNFIVGGATARSTAATWRAAGWRARRGNWSSAQSARCAGRGGSYATRTARSEALTVRGMGCGVVHLDQPRAMTSR